MKIPKSAPLLLLAAKSGSTDAFLTTKTSFVEKVGRKEPANEISKILASKKPNDFENEENKNKVDLKGNQLPPSTKGALAVSGTILGLAVLSQVATMTSNIEQYTPNNIEKAPIEKYKKCNEETDFCRYPGINIYHVPADMTWHRC